jgi:hypothetical protein
MGAFEGVMSSSHAPLKTLKNLVKIVVLREESASHLHLDYTCYLMEKLV